MSYEVFRVPIKGALPPSSASHGERHLGYRPLFYCLPKSPVNEPPPRPPGSPMEKDAHFQSLPFTYPTQSLVQEPSLRFPFQIFTRKVQP